jgi:hypothetical protein
MAFSTDGACRPPAQSGSSQAQAQAANVWDCQGEKTGSNVWDGLLRKAKTDSHVWDGCNGTVATL